MTGMISRTHGINAAWEIGIDGYRLERFMGYTKAEAIRRYKERLGLQGCHVRWRDYTKQGMPQNLLEAVTG